MFEGVFADIVTYIILGGIAGIASFCTAVYRCVQKQGKRGYRQSQAILLLAKSVERLTKDYHPDYQEDLVSEAEIILKDEKGNF